MSLKKTDLEKQFAKKLDGKMKSGLIPQRFGQSSAAPGIHSDLKQRNAVAKLVPIACRLPPELVTRLRVRAIGYEGGMNALLAQALELFLQTPAGTPAVDKT